MKKHLKNAMIRGGIPLLIMSGISLIMRWQELDAFQVRSTFFVGLIIAAVAAATVVYEVEAWPLSRQSLVHLGLMLVTVFPLLLLSGWFPVNSMRDAVKVLRLFLLVGATLWLVAFFVMTRLFKQKKQTTQDHQAEGQ